MYAINGTTGALTSIGFIDAGNAGTGPFPTSVAIHPSGKFAYVANQSTIPFPQPTGNNVSMYSIDNRTGALTVTGTVAAGTGPISVAIDPSGKFAYVANFLSHNISMYSIDAATGVLTLIGTIGT